MLLKTIRRIIDVKNTSRNNKSRMASCHRRDAYYVREVAGNLKKVDAQKLRLIEDFWKPYKFCYKNNPKTQIAFYSQSGVFDPSLVGFGLHRYMLVQYWNNEIFSVFRNKNYTRLLFPFVKHPENLASCSYGIYYDRDFNHLTFEQTVRYILTLLQQEHELIIKPALDSGSGSNIAFLTDLDKSDVISDQVKKLSPHFVCQKILKNHESYRIGINAVNTLRVVTLAVEGQIKLAGTVWRMSTGKRVDNWGAGGILCPVSPEGICGDFATSGKGEVYHRHPNGFEFKGHKLYKAREVIETAIECHKRLPQQKNIAWDFVVDEKGEIVLLEMNSPGGSEGIQSCGFNAYLNQNFAKNVFDNYIYLNKATFSWNYREFSDHVILLKYFGFARKLVIPSIFKGKPVKLVAASAFHDTNVREVMLPQQVSLAVSLIQNKSIKITTIRNKK